jgi:hypothetical protein
MEGLNRGYLTIDPSQFHDPNVCAPYRNISSTASPSKTPSQSPDPKRNNTTALHLEWTFLLGSLLVVPLVANIFFLGQFRS